MTPSRWRVVFEEKESAENFLSLNGQKISSGGVIQVRQWETRFTLEQVLAIITEKLEMNQRRALKMPPKPTENKSKWIRRDANFVGVE